MFPVNARHEGTMSDITVPLVTGLCGTLTVRPQNQASFLTHSLARSVSH